MVAYSFKPRFVDPILSGRKRQTIRYVGHRRHARAGETLQLYTGLRTKSCRLIGKALCREVLHVDLFFGEPSDAMRSFEVRIGTSRIGTWRITTADALNEFARADGFADLADMIRFWDTEHPAVVSSGRFGGALITWGDLDPECNH